MCGNSLEEKEETTDSRSNFSKAFNARVQTAGKSPKPHWETPEETHGAESMQREQSPWLIQNILEQNQSEEIVKKKTKWYLAF
jgi:hypothetical protein